MFITLISKVGVDLYYRIAGYIGGNNTIWQIARTRKKVQLADINLAVSYSTIAMPSLGVYTVGTILADLILAV